MPTQRLRSHPGSLLPVVAGLILSCDSAMAQLSKDSLMMTAPVKRTLRIMPLGDSITQGGQGYASYRYSLWFQLQAQGESVRFVGGNQTVFGGDGGSNPDTSLYPDYYTTFDRDHQGHWGWTTSQIFGISLDAASDARPDVVLVHLGTNDIGQSGASGVANAEIQLPRILDNIRAIRPVARFALAQVIPIGPGTSYFTNANQVGPLNQVIADVATDRNEVYSPVVVVDQNSGFDLDMDMQPDGLHPNEVGETKIASVWNAILVDSFLNPVVPDQPLVSVEDPSFEVLGSSDGTVEGTPSGIPWRFGATTNTFRGIFNPTSASYLGAAGSGTPQGADGDEVAYLYNNGGAFERVYLYQTLETTLQPSTMYVLQVAVGNRLASNPYGPSTYGGYRIELLAGNRVIASEADAFTPAPGTFEDAMIAVDSSSLPGFLDGQVLTIRLSLTGLQSTDATDFDHVRLSTL